MYWRQNGHCGSAYSTIVTGAFGSPSAIPLCGMPSNAATSPLSEPPPESPELITISATTTIAASRAAPPASAQIRWRRCRSASSRSASWRFSRAAFFDSDRELIGPRTYRLAITGFPCCAAKKADSAARDCGPPPAPATA